LRHFDELSVVGLPMAESMECRLPIHFQISGDIQTAHSRAANPAEGATMQKGKQRWQAALTTGWKARIGIAVLGAGAAACAFASASIPAGAASSRTLTVGYFPGLVAEPETVIGSVPSVAAKVPATIKWVPITAGVTALAELRAGSFDFVAGVGNPPTVASIANGTPVDVVWVQGFDADSLIVHKGVTKPSQLAGKTIGDLEGSSEDYEIRGWLTANKLTSSVKVVGFQSEQAAAAAWQSGAVDAAYVEGAIEITLDQHGGHGLTNAKKIAALGYPGINVLGVTESLIKSDPALVQKYVCAEATATTDLLGPKTKTYSAKSAGLLGVSASQAVQATDQYLSFYIPTSQEKHWLVGSNGSTASSPTVKAYVDTGKFDVAQGRITSAPSASLLASHIVPKFALNALAGHC
jgi:taurine transport system substrate-binding protein